MPAPLSFLFPTSGVQTEFSVVLSSQNLNHRTPLPPLLDRQLDRYWCL
jgi:hypothetical protein